MAAKLKTAPEVIDSTTKLQDKLAAERRQHNKAVNAEKLALEFYEDLRDDISALVRESHLTWEEIHARNGPHPSTLKKWDEKATRKPQFGKLQSTARIVGYDIGIIPGPRSPAIRKVVMLP